MTEREYRGKVTEIETKYQDDLRSLRRKYALSHNDVKFGDIVTDHRCSIKVEKILVRDNYTKVPDCIYEGITVKKDGTPKKRQETDQIYQCNLKFINGKPINND